MRGPTWGTVAEAAIDWGSAKIIGPGKGSPRSKNVTVNLEQVEKSNTSDRNKMEKTCVKTFS